ncbi:MAG: PilZ domain-containing protein [Candidatus Sericytochromatia bacterium]|nr:PilZ domain-containing protein [Candidatus Tanganyikabacteria bacterium]
MHYEIGQEVTLRLGDRVLKGKITDMTVSSAVMSFPVPFELPPSGMVVWPDGMVARADMSQASPSTNVMIKLPFPTRSEGARLPAPLPAAENKATDHRRTVRIDVSLPLTVADFTGTRRLMDARTLNMSSGGALVLCESNLIVGRDYTLKLELLAELIALKARVVRRLGRNTYAFRFLADSDTGHGLMRKVFMLLRGSESSSGKRPSWNFRRG